jgi:hypothetical protein
MQPYVNGHNFQSDSWIGLKFYLDILETLFSIELKFHTSKAGKAFK